MAGNNLDLTLLDLSSQQVTPITVNAGDNYTPAPTPDGRYIVFASNRSGSLNLWRVNAADGSEPNQLTFTDGNSYPNCSADSQWVAFDDQSATATVVRKVAIDGGPPDPVIENARMPVFSPDGQQIAVRFQGEIAIVSAHGGAPFQRVPIPVMDWQQVQWAADGKSLTYIKTADGTSNLWTYDLKTGSTNQLTNFTTNQIFAYAWSPDRTQLACHRGSEITDVILLKQ
jgi:Tol biopolymer transport system component